MALNSLLLPRFGAEISAPMCQVGKWSFGTIPLRGVRKGVRSRSRKKGSGAILDMGLVETRCFAACPEVDRSAWGRVRPR